jgi:hypothetical protein
MRSVGCAGLLAANDVRQTLIESRNQASEGPRKWERVNEKCRKSMHDIYTLC